MDYLLLNQTKLAPTMSQYNRRKYVPYATQRQREEQEERERKLAQEEAEKKKLENTEENFPTMLGSGLAPPPKIMRKSFANLASEWKEHEEDKKAYEIMEPKYPALNLPKFHTIHRFVESEDQEDEQVEEPPKETPQEDEWIEVKSKYKPRREKTLIEKYGDPDASEEEVKEEEDTVWRESHQTCWDDKTN